jgi:hypothetical protein
MSCIDKASFIFISMRICFHLYLYILGNSMEFYNGNLEEMGIWVYEGLINEQKRMELRDWK